MKYWSLIIRTNDQGVNRFCLTHTKSAVDALTSLSVRPPSRHTHVADNAPLRVLCLRGPLWITNDSPKTSTICRLKLFNYIKSTGIEKILLSFRKINLTGGTAPASLSSAIALLLTDWSIQDTYPDQPQWSWSLETGLGFHWPSPMLQPG